MEKSLHKLNICSLLFITFLLACTSLKAQVSINNHGGTPDSSAMLEVESSDRGFLMPRLTTTQRIAINNPAEGLMVYDTDSQSFWYFSNAWLEISEIQKFSIENDSLKINTATGKVYAVAQNEIAGLLSDDNDNFYSNNISSIPQEMKLDSGVVGNLAIGGQSLNSLEHTYFDSDNNIALGYGTLRLTKVPSGNSAVGGYALFQLGKDVGSVVQKQNTAFGYSSLRTITSGSYNLGIGNKSGFNLDSGNYNVYVGSNAGPENGQNDKYESNKLYVESGSASSNTPLIGGDFDQNRVGINMPIDSMSTGATLQVGGDLSLQNGEDVDEFSSDETLADSSHTAIPTEAAVKYYVDNSVENAYQTLSLIEDTLFISGSDHSDFQADLSSLVRLATSGNTNVHGGTSNFSSLDANNATGNTAIGRSALNDLQQGNHNSSFGRYSLLRLENANYNTSMGSSALREATDTDNQTAMGYSALREHKYGSDNVALGNEALRRASGGSYNVALGSEAMAFADSGSYNIALGYESLNSIDGADSNIAIGSQALHDLLSGNANVAIGGRAGQNYAGEGSVFLGHNAGATETSTNNVLYIANSNTSTPLIGGDFANIKLGINKAVSSLSSGATLQVGGDLSLQNGENVDEFSSDETLADSSHTAIPTEAAVKAYVDNYGGLISLNNENMHSGGNNLSMLTTGVNNIAIGTNSMSTAQTASSNTSIGAHSLFSLTSGRQNVALGESSLYNLTDGDHNIAIGASALNAATSASDNIAIGGLSLFSLTTGTDNIAIGKIALTNLSTGIRNVAIGNSSLSNLTTGSNNIGMGQYALLDATTGSINTALGHYSLSNLTTGTSNIALGYYALHNLNDGDYNIGIGQSAQSKLSSGSNNISLGYQSLDELTTGNDNIAIGANTLRYAQDDDENIAIGNGAGEDYQKTGSVFIGHNAGADENTYDGTLYIANDNTATPLIGGLFPDNLQQIPTGRVGINRSLSDLSGANGASFQVNGTASKTTSGNWAGNSDKRLKTNISYMSADSILQQVLAMKGVTYYWNDSVTGYERPEGMQHGFIAQDLQKVWPSKITEDGQGYLMAAYGDYDPMFVEAIKSLYAQLQEMKTLNQKQRNEIEQIRAENNTYKQEQQKLLHALLKRVNQLEANKFSQTAIKN